MNSQHYIIAGPHTGDYWNHSPGLKRPLIREEGPFPVQGNIGSLVQVEGPDGTFTKCGSGPNISGSPNCTRAFIPDIYTRENTCGKECALGYPESFGGQSFGLLPGQDVTNAYALHAYKNVRAAQEGSGPSSVYGCYEWIPNLSKTAGNSCIMDYPKQYQQVGNWMKLPQNRSIVGYSFNK